MGAYQRWLRAQGEGGGRCDELERGELRHVRALRSRRAPGSTCLSALRTRPGQRGTFGYRVAQNGSKGCGGVMRAAPCGLAGGDAEQAFAHGVASAALTHGHPSGYLAAGALALIIRELCDGSSLAVDAPSASDLAAWLKEHAAVATQIASRLRDRAPGAALSEAGGGSFIGHRVHIPDVLGRELRLRLYASPAGAGLALVGEPDSLIVAIERDAGGTREAPASQIFAEAGLPRERDLAGFWMYRRAWPMADAVADPVVTAESIWQALAITGLEPWDRDGRHG